jgi:predicted DNA-binding ribbon-helix-helix protein
MPKSVLSNLLASWIVSTIGVVVIWQGLLSSSSWFFNSKSHALDGHLLSLFLMQSFMDALKDLAEHDVKDPEILLAQLQEEDDRVFHSFASAAVPVIAHGFNSKKWDDDHTDLIDLFFKGPSICRTARLPAKSRFLGYMTNNGKTGDIAVLGNETYDTGIELTEAKETAKESNKEMRLVYEDDPRARNRNCVTALVKPDYKDFYFTHSSDSWMKLAFPNKAEKAAYAYDRSRFKGLLALHLVVCDWGNCKAEDMREDGLEKGELEINVNGQAVKSVDNINGLIVLKGKQGMYWEPRPDGDYEIAVRVKVPDSYFRISAIILL